MRLKLCFIALLALFAGSVMADGLIIPDDKALIQFPARPGNVTFAHKKHADLSITECTTCHHKFQPDDTVIPPCHECHKHKTKEAKQAGAPKTKTAFHTRCIGCHEYTVAGGEQAGPVKKKCKLCHVK
jgi:hypothetical protein